VKPAKAKIHQNGVLQNHSSKQDLKAPPEFFSPPTRNCAPSETHEGKIEFTNTLRAQTPATAAQQAGDMEKPVNLQDVRTFFSVCKLDMFSNMLPADLSC
jgi:hypothetical protein